jgi:hypothetical protein
MSPIARYPVCMNMCTAKLLAIFGKGQTTSHGFAVDLLAICWRHNGVAGDLMLSRSASKSTANLQQIRVMWCNPVSDGIAQGRRLKI